VLSFADKVVLITGTARGCGAVLAEAFAKAGSTVVWTGLHGAVMRGLRDR
jgi:NAD(P)-dependent dehydrogenase (short-subunit alcohol dehydrogenase family)